MLIENSKIPEKQCLKNGEIDFIKRRQNKNFVSLCIRDETTESISIIQAKIYTTLTLLQDFLIKIDQKEVSIAKSENVENLDWNEVVNLINTIFANTGISVLGPDSMFLEKNETRYFTNCIIHQ